MSRFFFSGYVSIHVDNKEINLRLDLVHQLFAPLPVIAAPLQNAFPAVSVFSCQCFFWLELIISVFLAGQLINNAFDDDLVSRSLAHNSNRFHKSVGTPPSLPLIHSRDKD